MKEGDFTSELLLDVCGHYYRINKHPKQLLMSLRLWAAMLFDGVSALFCYAFTKKTSNRFLLDVTMFVLFYDN